MTDSCATCISYLSTGHCRLNPPTGNRQYPPVASTDWCAQFSLESEHASGAYTSQSIAANATSTFWSVLKSDGTLWLSLNNGVSWTQVTGP